MKTTVLTALVLTVAALPAQDLAIPTQRVPTDQPGVEIHTRDLRPLARLIQIRRRTGADASAELTVAAITRSLADGVRGFVEPALASGEDVRLLADRYLVAIGRTAQQNWIDRFLRSQVGTAGELVEIEIHLFQAGATALEKAAIGHGARALSRQAGIELARALEQDRIAHGATPEVLQVSSYPLAKNRLARLNQVSYVRDFETMGKPGGVLIADPQVDIAQDGMLVDSTAFHLEGGKLGVRGKISFSDILLPFPTKDVAVLGGGVPLTIQVPARREFEIGIDLALDDGGYATLPGPVFEGKRLVAMLRARTTR